MVMLVGAVVSQTSTRFAQSHQDRSVSNRLVIWKQAPQMMVDAPWGWDIRNSGKAYMNWYQPLENTEQYRTLVNSHLTWLVELSWPMRLFYMLGWAAVIVLCCGSRRFESTKSHLFCGIVCGMWTAFFVAATFSSVAEVPQLWILPVLGLIGVIAIRYKQHLWPSRPAWAIGVAVAILSLGTLAICGYTSIRATQITALKSGAVCIGAKMPKTWIVIGASTEGNAAIPGDYPRVYREQKALPPVGFASSLAALPTNLVGCKLIVIGALKDWSALPARAKTCESILLLAPDAFPDKLNLPKETSMRVVFGEYTNRPSATAWQGTGLTEALEGVGDFFQDWPLILFDNAQ